MADDFPITLIEKVNFAGAIASLVGLILTGIIYYRIRYIKKYYHGRIRLPELLERLIAKSTDINSKLNVTMPFDHLVFTPEIARLSGILKGVKNKVDRNISGNCQRLINKINKISKKAFVKNDIDYIYSDLQEIIESLDQHIKDTKLET